MIDARRLVVCALVSAVCGGTARAQTPAQPLSGRNEVAFGVSWVGTSSFGAIDATLTGPSGDRVRLFSTSTELVGAPAFEVRFGRRLTRGLQAEVSASYATPMLTTSITADAESGANTVASESLRQWTILGGLVAWLPRWRIGGRVTPFVAGGGGYLRELHEGDTLAQGGRAFYAGGGAAIPLVTRSQTRRLKEVGVRVDGRALFRSEAMTVDGRVHASPVLTASVFARF